MQGGNEAWIIVYNRFRIADGRAIFAGNSQALTTSFVATLSSSRKRRIQPCSSNPTCTGIELEDNIFYGPVKTVSGFLKVHRGISREENNRVLPYTDAAPPPDPAAKSIFEWQRTTPLQGQSQPL